MKMPICGEVVYGTKGKARHETITNIYPYKKSFKKTYLACF